MYQDPFGASLTPRFVRVKVLLYKTKGNLPSRVNGTSRDNAISIQTTLILSDMMSVFHSGGKIYVHGEFNPCYGYLYLCSQTKQSVATITFSDSSYEHWTLRKMNILVEHLGNNSQGIRNDEFFAPSEI